MRRLLLALPLCIPFYAHAQQAANPVEPFSYGVRTGTPQNPIVAALSSVVPSAHAGSTQAAAPVELFSYGRRVGTQSNPIYVNLGSALDAYVTQVSLTSTLSAYLTTAAAASTYLPLAGGTLKGNISAGPPGTTSRTLKIGGAVFEGTFGAPDSDLYQGSALAWNSLKAINSSGVFGETDFYNLQGLGTGGFAWCTGTTVAACQSNVLMNLTSSGVVFGKGATIAGNASISGTVTMSGATGTGNAYACITSAGVVYRSSTACQ